jgi:hypothetical protein
MTDRREQILAKLETILAAIDGVQFCGRNRDQLPDGKRPAILLLDGDEEGGRSADHRNRIGASPNLVLMKPEIYFALDDRKPQNENVGQDANAMRVKILKAVLNDQGLTGLCTNVFYAGVITDLARGREMIGQMGLMFEFTYALKPSEL